MTLLIKNARVLIGTSFQNVQVLAAAGRVLAIAEDMPTCFDHCEVVDARGHYLLPGILDQHVHLIGGGGEAGFHTRTPEVQLGQLVRGGITTVMGLLGTDGVTRHVESLFAKVMGLRNEGLSAYMVTGSYEVPTVTITGSVSRDMIFIEPVLGLKTAISDHRSSAPTTSELVRMATLARSASLLTQKPGLVVLHLGNAASVLSPLYAVLDQCDVPVSHFLPTHVNRKRALFDDALHYAKSRNGNIDITSGISPVVGASGSVKPSECILEALDNGISLTQLTFSSDGNGSIPAFNEQGEVVGLEVAGFDSLMGEVKDLSRDLPLEQAWSVVSSNVATRLQLSRKGRIAVGADADFVMLDEELNLHSVWAMGKRMMTQGQLCVKGTFE